ncbi:hypothetical protein ACQPW1_39510 [Nocardia sp. CA-128927]|uniref:hypothetical protein n=1 Tax=Nocardia sp. CA-128927 TaxID=3239975 RepID=UPI003D992A88
MPKYAHSIYGPDAECVGAVAATLAEAGYLVDEPLHIGATCERLGCPGRTHHHWLLIAYGPLEKAFAHGGRDDITSACALHNAIYRGGIFFVIPPPIPIPGIESETGASDV